MSQSVKAILLMVLAMASFAVGDVMVKIAAARMPVSEVLFFISLGSLILFGAMALASGKPIISRQFWAHGVLLRNAAEVLGTACIVLALAAAPLVQVVAINQVLPVLVTLGAVFILGEKVGPRRWIAVLIGLVGVLIVLRPGPDLEIGAILALGAAIGLGLRDVFTRLVPKEVAILSLAVWAMAFLVPVSVVMLLVDGRAVQPQGTDWAVITGALLATALAYISITASVRLAEISIVSPFRYSRLLFGTALGVWVFGETLDGPTIVGASLIVAAGLYILLRERHVSALPHDAKVR